MKAGLDSESEIRRNHWFTVWIVRGLGAIALIGLVHAFMIYFAVPTPAAWYLGAIIYAGLLAVLLARMSMLDKLFTYMLFAIVTVVGSLTVCPCTGAHFLAAPAAGLAFLGFVQWLRMLWSMEPFE
jgi:hypothetical protein